MESMVWGPSSRITASSDWWSEVKKEKGEGWMSIELCLHSGIYQAAVQQDVEEGTQVGVTGTPTFFINGRLLVGAQPLESFVRVSEEELARAR